MPPRPAPARLRRWAAAPMAVALCVGVAVLPAAAHAQPSPATVPATVPSAGQVQAADQGLTTWWYDAMKLGTLHKEATGKGVKIAVIDEAIDPDAPELRGADVTLGKDCLGDRVKPATGTKADHGTNVVSLIVGTGRGTGPGGKGIRGIAPDAQVTFYASDANPKDARVDCDTSITSGLVKEALAGKPDIITTSLGLGADDTTRDLLDRAIDEGVVVVGATGDRTRPYLPHFPMAWPAAWPGVVAVNAADKTGRAWPDNPPPVHSFIDAYPTVTGPGVHVTGMGYQTGRGWVSGVDRTGTSDAAPLVAGALALLKSRYPEATGNQLIQQLVHHTSGGKFQWDRFYGYGLISPRRMLASDPTGWPDENPLLHGPRRALKDFPSSVYDVSRASASASAQPSDGDSASAASAPSDDGGASTAAGNSSDSSASSSSSGAPVWVWPLAAIVVAGLAGAVLVTNRRGSRRPTTTAAREEG